MTRAVHNGDGNRLIVGGALGREAGVTLVSEREDSLRQIDSIKVRDSIYMLTGKSGNIGVLLGEDGTFMIDEKFAPLTDAILAKLTELVGTTPRFVINTPSGQKTPTY